MTEELTVDEILQRASDAWAQLVRAFADVIAPVLREVTRIVRRFYDSILRSVAERPREYHLYKHARKLRVRKTYERRLRERLILLLAEECTP